MILTKHDPDPKMLLKCSYPIPYHNSTVAGLICLVWSQVRPPNYSPDQLPETSFTCEDKVGNPELGLGQTNGPALINSI